jgi:endonuclease YncB( thermonuclease family)
MMVRFKIFLLFGLLAAAALEAGSTTHQEPRLVTSEQSRESTNAGSEKRVVIRVIDGDTIVVNPTFSTRIDMRFFYGFKCEKVSSFQGVTVSKWL